MRSSKQRCLQNLSPKEHEDLAYRKAFLHSVERGLTDAENGRVYQTGEIKAALARRRKKGSRG